MGSSPEGIVDDRSASLQYFPASRAEERFQAVEVGGSLDLGHPAAVPLTALADDSLGCAELVRPHVLNELA